MKIVFLIISFILLTRDSVFATISYNVETDTIDINNYSNISNKPLFEDPSASFGKTQDKGSGLKNPSVVMQVGSGANNTSPFVFSLSSRTMDFGVLTPADPILRSHIFSVTNGSSLGSSVFLSQNHLLIDETSKAIIPNTTCDNGACTHELSAPWENILTYGFGYTCQGSSCQTTSNYYKQIISSTDITRGMVIVDTNTFYTKTSLDMLFKINIPGTQPLGNYKNTITYIAAPHH